MWLVGIMGRLQAVDIEPLVPARREDLDEPLAVKPYVWLSQQGVVTPLHYDYYHNLYPITHYNIISPFSKCGKKSRIENKSRILYNKVQPHCIGDLVICQVPPAAREEDVSPLPTLSQYTTHCLGPCSLDVSPLPTLSQYTAHCLGPCSLCFVWVKYIDPVYLDARICPSTLFRPHRQSITHYNIVRFRGFKKAPTIAI